jgi:AraC-like DNA-binding protein
MDYSLTIKAVVDYIESHVTEDLPVEELATMMGFSVPHLRAVFRTATGMSLAYYIRRRRLCHAAAELVRSRRSITDIALTYGFNSHDVFTRAFLRAFGETPSVFRQHNRPVTGTLIVPGVFGPSVTKEEGVAMSTETSGKQNGAAGTLYGVVPKVCYNEREVTPFPSCLRSCLSYMGQEVPYSRLMAASGAPFRLMWNLERRDGGNVDIMIMRPDATEPLRRAFWAIGRDYYMLCKPGIAGHLIAENSTAGVANVGAGTKEDFIALIKREINCWSAGHRLRHSGSA